MATTDQAAKTKMIKIERCVYCNGFIENENVLKCQECRGNVHIKCLPNERTPGDLIGDIFFDLTCIDCVKKKHVKDGEEMPSSSQSSVVKEVLVRKRLPWLIILVLVFYNLSIKSKNVSHHGYFHWQNHIANFVEKNWKYLFTMKSRRRKRWIGTIAGVLSQYSPDFFLSGAEECRQSGWWKLTHANRTPKYIFMLYEQYCQKRQQDRLEKRPPIAEVKLPVEPKKLRHSADSEEDSMLTGTCSRAIPYMGRKPKVAKQLNIDEEDSRTAVQSNLMDFLAETFSNDDLTMFNSLPSEALGSVGAKNEFIPFLETHEDNAHLFDLPEIKVDKQNVTSSPGVTESVNTIGSNDLDKTIDHLLMLNNSAPQMSLTCNDLENDTSDNEVDDDDKYRPRIVQVVNFQQSLQTVANDHAISDLVQENVKNEVLYDVERNKSVSESNIGANIETQSSVILKREISEETPMSLSPCKPSLFTKQMRRLWPWLVQTDETSCKGLEAHSKNENETLQDQDKCLEHMSVYEESELLSKLRKIFALELKCQLEIPTYIRRFYRKLCVREWKRAHCKQLFDLDNGGNSQLRDAQQNRVDSTILDRYQLVSVSESNSKKSFYARIAGSAQHEFLQSPYTKRVLHPFIYRNKTCFPPWLKLLCEIQYNTTGVSPQRASIDYCYVRPNHIAAVNALLQTLFWPGIDMSDCLSYPDYSIVALYKQLIIGCGFLVPDVGYNEAYISFMAVRPGWQRSGIATFMLYHLTQTCMTKDITLHVSATNPAVMLYQKFGFKVEEIVLNFYDKYLPLDSKHSRHALFLRLSK